MKISLFLHSSWIIQLVYPGRSSKWIAETAADFFNRISKEFDQLPPLQDLSEHCPAIHEVASKLKCMKKPKSMVSGDIDPRLVSRFSDLLAIPVHTIFQKVYQHQEWPQLWAAETVTLIPKVPAPESLAQMRNISYTPLFSKCLESFVLASLKSAVKLSDNQFGGIKGVSVDHLLGDTWNDIMTSLEDPRACVNLMSIDFEKAFNRMCPQNCLSSLQRLGAHPHHCMLVGAFLRNRVMQVKIDGTVSEPRLVPGGAPQGSVLGSFLFCAATDALGQDLTGTEQAPIIGEAHFSGVAHTTAEFDENGVDVSDISSSSLTLPSPIAPPWYGELPSDESDDEFTCFREGRAPMRILGDTAPELSFRYTGDQIMREFGTPEDWIDPGLKVKVYIDDINNVDKICHTNSVSVTSQEKRLVLAHAQQCETNFNAVKCTAERLKMKVNDNKTQLLCVSGNTDNDIRSYIRTEAGTEIKSGSELKLLGFWFGTRPNASLHIQKISTKFRSRLWAMRNLKRAWPGQT